MNYSTAVFLINKHVRAIRATYEADLGAKEELFKTLDETIQVGDFVIVPTETRHKMTVCKVQAVNADVDFDSTVQIRWIIQKIDRASFDQTVAQESKAIEVMKLAEFKQKRDALKAAIFASDPEAVKMLALSSNGDTPHT